MNCPKCGMSSGEAKQGRNVQERATAEMAKMEIESMIHSKKFRRLHKRNGWIGAGVGIIFLALLMFFIGFFYGKEGMLGELLHRDFIFVALVVVSVYVVLYGWMGFLLGSTISIKEENDLRRSFGLPPL